MVFSSNDELMFKSLNVSDEQKSKILAFEELSGGLFGPNAYILGAGEEYLQTARTYQRFLQARDWDLSKAEMMFSQHLTWRKTHKINEEYQKFNLEQHELDAINRNCPLAFFGHDKQNRPIQFQSLSKIDAADFFQAIPEERVLTIQCMFIEALLRSVFSERTKISGQFVGSFHIVSSVNNMGFFQLLPFRKFGLQFLDIMESQYPECMGKITILHVPTAFALFWALIKPLIPQRTLNKISILSCKESAELESDIDPEFIVIKDDGSLPGSRALKVINTEKTWPENIDIFQHRET